MSNSNYHIIFPMGDRTRLEVVEICYGLEYELYDYSVASRQSFSSFEDASLYARKLAQEHGLTYISNNDEDYLD